MGFRVLVKRGVKTSQSRGPCISGESAGCTGHGSRGGLSSLGDPGVLAPGCLFQSDVLLFEDVLASNKPRHVEATVRFRCTGRVCPQTPVSNRGGPVTVGVASGSFPSSILIFILKRKPILPSQARTEPHSCWGRPRG